MVSGSERLVAHSTADIGKCAATMHAMIRAVDSHCFHERSFLLQACWLDFVTILSPHRLHRQQKHGQGFGMRPIFPVQGHAMRCLRVGPSFECVRMQTSESILIEQMVQRKAARGVDGAIIGAASRFGGSWRGATCRL